MASRSPIPKTSSRFSQLRRGTGARVARRMNRHTPGWMPMIFHAWSPVFSPPDLDSPACGSSNREARGIDPSAQANRHAAPHRSSEITAAIRAPGQRRRCALAMRSRPSAVCGPVERPRCSRQRRDHAIERIARLCPFPSPGPASPRNRPASRRLLIPLPRARVCPPFDRHSRTGAQ